MIDPRQQTHLCIVSAEAMASLAPVIDAGDRSSRNPSGWLEQYVFAMVTALQARLGIQDAACTVEVLSDDGVKNELDVAFLASNTFHMIECKSKQLARRDSNDDHGEGTASLYKLEALKWLGGELTRMMLVSYQQVRDRDRLRARERGIAIVSGRELEVLDKKITDWVYS